MSLNILNRRIIMTPALGSGGVSLSYARTDAVADLTANTIYTFSNVNIGPASATRVILVGCQGYGSGTPQPAASLKIGGVSASLLAGTNVIQNGIGSGVFVLVVPAGTTATIELTWAGPMLSGGIIVYALDAVNVTPSQIDTDQGFTASLASSVTIPVGGVAISFANSQLATIDGTFTNAVEDGSGITVSINADNAVRFQSAHNIIAGAQTPTFTPPGSDALILNTIAFGP